jgi:surfactin synthase thioesterase subunit
VTLSDTLRPPYPDGTNRWIQPSRTPTAPLQLFCLAHAGGGGAFFAPWRSALAPDIDVRPVLLPGRESRIREPLLTRVEPVVDAISYAIAAERDRPFALFGHSLGAVLAFEVARQLERVWQLPARALIVSGRRAPLLPRRRPRYSLMSEQDFRDAVVHLNGTPQDVLDHPGIFSLMLPVLRADFQLNEDYRRMPGPQLDVPLWACGGDHDPEVALDELMPWREETSAAFTLNVFRGDHFYLKSDPEPLWSVLRSALLHGAQ